MQRGRLHVDKAWSFYYCKQKNLTPEIAEQRIAGDVSAWVAIDADTKLIPSWLLDKRDSSAQQSLLQDLSGRPTNRVQLNTDGPKVYIDAVFDAFGSNADYWVLHKIYGSEPTGEARCSPAKCIGWEKKSAIGNPDEAHIITSYF